MEPDQLYVRFGDWHSSETSRIYAGEAGSEVGVSVYRADALEDGTYDLWVVRDYDGEIAGDLVETFYALRHFAAKEGEPIYVLRGEFVGWGYDGEPLIQDIEIVKEIGVDRIRATDAGVGERLDHPPLKQPGEF